MRQKLLAVSGWVVAGAVVLVGAGEKLPGKLKLQELDIVDEKGESCIKMREMGGYPTILMKGPKSKGVQAAIGVTELGPSIILSDVNSQMARLSIGVTSKGATIGIRDRETGKIRVMLTADNSGESSLTVGSAVDRPSGITLSSGEDGAGFILVQDKDGKARFVPAP